MECTRLPSKSSSINFSIPDNPFLGIYTSQTDDVCVARCGYGVITRAHNAIVSIRLLDVFSPDGSGERSDHKMK